MLKHIYNQQNPYTISRLLKNDNAQCILPKSQSINIANLSNHQLAENETRLLAKGLSFCPSKNLNPVDLWYDMEDYIRRIKLKEYFHNNNQQADTNSTTNKRAKDSKSKHWTPANGRNLNINITTQ